MKKTHKNTRFNRQRKTVRYDIFFYKDDYIKNILNPSEFTPTKSLKGFFIFCELIQKKIFIGV